MANPFPIPLNAIRAIEIVARRGALAPAAEELGVTPGAVSQHIRRAEERLGVELFERTPQGPAADRRRSRASCRSSPPALLARATRSPCIKGGNENVLVVTMGSVFASRWMIWRVGKFLGALSRHRVPAGGDRQHHRPAHADVDCAIRYGRGPWPGVKARADRRRDLPAGLRAVRRREAERRRPTSRRCR